MKVPVFFNQGLILIMVAILTIGHNHFALAIFIVEIQCAVHDWLADR